ncbi:MAG: NUDIX hydrolase [Candidatus Moranbacteria bacterium GW2011_GWE2_47_10]|nr:MAG: NUDIX hydrolase [Candidatus Moranbacteria bacterium GW2011_GWE2_47_10]
MVIWLEDNFGVHCQNPREGLMAVKVACILIEKEGRILLVKDGDFWSLPGGKIEKGESEIACMKREVAEEICEEVISVTRRLPGLFRGISPTRRKNIEVAVFVGDIAGSGLSQEGEHESCWFAWDNVFSQNLSVITENILKFYLRIKKGE